MSERLSELAREIAALEAEAERMLMRIVDLGGDGRCFYNFCTGKISVLQLLRNVLELERVKDVNDPEIRAAVEKIKLIIRLARKAGVNLRRLAEEALFPPVR